MSFMDNIIEKIKNMLNRSKQKALPEGMPQRNINTNLNERKKFLEANKHEVENNVVFGQGTIENAIQQYIQGLAFSAQNGEKINTYKTLTNLSAVSNQEQGNNAKLEKIMVFNLKTYSEKYKVQEQKNNDDVAFYHVESKKQTPYNPKDTVRFYINTKRKNIAELSDLIINSFGNEEFKMKFIADNQLDKRDRTESIVIYEKKDNLNRTISMLNNLIKTYPNMFENSEAMNNPFLQRTCGGKVAYAPEVDENYVDFRGQKRMVARSFNTKLSLALAESYMKSVWDIVREKKDLQKSLDMNMFKNINIYDGIDNNDKYAFANRINSMMLPFASSYPEISKKYERELIQRMKENLYKVKERNPELQIKTTEEKQQKENENQR